MSFTSGNKHQDRAIARSSTFTMVIADPSGTSRVGKLSLSLVVLAMSLLGYLIFNSGEMFSSRISESALQVLTKIMGLILTAIAAQMHSQD